ncbi:MAG: tRNA uridine 5-carboxymethylaminomethyl modification protein, partial [Proteobacteria bacterium]|nr:tRNA uridine 5-carboxymethylaminomethyl modification protein [Pseudomonadota bacterium]
MDYSLLFDKINIRNVELKNRIVFPPISTNFANPDGSVSERLIAHYERRAKGGAGFIIVENSCIDWPKGKKGAFQPRIDSEEMIDGWRELTERVHKYGAKVSVELTHPGYEGKDINDLSEEEISFLINKYVEAALIAKRSGFDMVEIQGAHGLLVNKFLSPLTNKREDIWGKRLRFAIEIRIGI